MTAFKDLPIFITFKIFENSRSLSEYSEKVSILTIRRNFHDFYDSLAGN
jgi:hypothetical protein